MDAITCNENNAWMKHIKQALETTAIQESHLLSMSKHQAKAYIHKQVKNYQRQKIYKAAENKSKVRDYVCLKNREDILKDSKFMNNLSRTNYARIIHMRARMLKVRGNYQNQDTNQQCRWCKGKFESQMHIMTKCPNFISITNNVKYSTYFKDDENSIKTTIEKLNKVIPKIHQDTTSTTEENRRG